MNALSTVNKLKSEDQIYVSEGGLILDSFKIIHLCGY